MKEIRIHGRGGQGAVLAAELLVVAAFEDGKYGRRPVTDYLRPQKRFRHLFELESGPEHIAAIQAIADDNIVRLGLGA